ncbi:hypothetical protein [Burkholderia latens]|uniref:hypothetical protein n=1 Tax=Burkholderia latens TaxID=488446 RepID=UPI001FC7FB81|nr:hypothetical protein [Burkholderia latens]
MWSPSANSSAAPPAPVSRGTCPVTSVITLPRSMPGFAISVWTAMLHSSVSAGGIVVSAV